MSSKHSKAGSRSSGNGLPINSGAIGTTISQSAAAPSTDNAVGSGPQVNVDKQISGRHETGTIPKGFSNKPGSTTSFPRRNPPRDARPNRQSSCQLCDGLDNMNMIQCDACRGWFHCECAKVTDETEDQSWSCAKCAALLRRSLAPSGDGRNSEVQMQQIPNPSQRSRSSGKSMQSEARRRLKLQLMKIEEEKRLEKEFLERKYEVLLEFGSESSTVVSDSEAILDNASKIEQWMADTDCFGADVDSGVADEVDGPVAINSRRPAEHSARNLRQNVEHSVHQLGQQPSLTGRGFQFANSPIVSNHPAQPAQLSHTRAETVMQPNRFIPGQRSTPMGGEHQRPTVQPVQLVDDKTICILNRSQLAARQAVPKDLPEFGGNPEDWPLFFSVFNSSTQMCGFSNEENMLRLRKCLTGRALEAVRCRLLHPSNVAGVMSTLKMLYGRPEAIVQAIVKKVRALPSPNIDRLETVVNFALTVENLVATIQACGVNDFVYNASLRYELVEKLPSSLKLDWAKYSRNTPIPNLLDFSTWLYSTAEDASAVMASVSSDSKPRSNKKDGFLNVHAEGDSDSNHVASSKAKQYTSDEMDKECPICKGGCPNVAKCKQFAEFSCDSKWAAVRECKLCRKCLRRHNGSCRQQKACGTNGCTYLHHPLLHTVDRQQSNGTATNAIVPAETTQQSCNIHQSQSKLLFRILPVLLYGPSKTVRTYAFIDDGSELSIMEQSLANELGIEGPKTSLCLKWTGGSQRLENSSQRVSLQISSSNDQSRKYQLSSVQTVKSLQIRPQTLLYGDLQETFRHLAGLPIESYENACPRVLIGLDNLNLGHPLKSREGRPQEPIAAKTRLGCTIYGSCAPECTTASSVNYHSLQVCECNQYSDEDLHQTVKNYFLLDSIGIVKPDKLLQSRNDQRAQMLLESHTKQRDGRYESGLLWKYDTVRLPDSKPMALKRWECLDRRMKNDPQLANVVRAKIEEHVSKGYIRKLSDEEVQAGYPRVWYLPIFPVVNPNKPGKTRLVWDAAATVHGVSLNTVLLKGPDLLTSLLSVLMQFREYKIAVCGDIREMYHQIQMRNDDQHCQRFFWKEHITDVEPSTYIVQVMTFGACCSPSTAQYVKNVHASKFQQEYPAAVEAIVKRHYVDDMLLSVEQEEEAVQLTRDVREIHASAGFEIRNWASNSSTVLAQLGEPSTAEKSFGEDGCVEKILGMWWNTSTDHFTFKISNRIDEVLLSGGRRPTKREVLRILMMVFDPLGFIGHFLMVLKTLLQEIWRSSIGWDDVINDQHFEKWSTWCAALPKIAELQIPRCYRSLTSISEDNEVQLHTFVDASEAGFAAVAYLRFQEGPIVECALLGSKTRVSPLKFLSIPRSELQAAVIGVRLAQTVCSTLSFAVKHRFFWTDSKDVLCWLNSDHRRYSQFVAFRVSEVLEVSDIREWNWIPTKQNVADEGTKWRHNSDLSSSSRWFRGPEFLWKSAEHWPSSKHHIGSTTEELRPHLLHHTKVDECAVDISRFSDWQKMLRCTAYVLRYVRNLRLTVQKADRNSGPLNSQELRDAENYLYRVAQLAAFADELQSFRRTGTRKIRTSICQEVALSFVSASFWMKLRLLGSKEERKPVRSSPEMQFNQFFFLATTQSPS
ncbi:uncharacterized protein LOC134285671 [Aedes albopictus]|uniref:PHD-type domain-containing protein n=1 Tax=Aedes albopictus TaxID=7160 RepID=A0ABM1ZTQ2_AEDAL